MNHHPTPVPEPSPSNEKKKRFLPNNRYFTICIYALVIILLGSLIVRVVMTPYAVTRGIQRILNVLMPFLIGALIAMILNPIINYLYLIMTKYMKIRNRKLCRVIASVLAYCMVLGLIMVCIVFIVPQIFTSITDLINSLPKLYRMTYDFFDTLQERFPDLDTTEIQNAINKVLPDMIAAIQNFASNLVPAIYLASVSIVKWVINTLIALIVSIYIIIDKKLLKKIIKILLYTFVPKSYTQPVITVLRECNHIFTSFIVGKAIDSLIIGILCFVSMTIFHLDYALLISVIVGITNMIPYFGPFIGAIPGALVLLMVSPLESLGFLVLILVLQQFDGLYLGPKILGDSMGMRPLWIIISITLGEKIAGVLGMFLSVPICAILVYLFNLLIEYCLKKKQLQKEDFL